MAHMRAPSPSARLPSLRCTASLPNLSSCTYAQALCSDRVYSACEQFAGTQIPLSIMDGPHLMPCRLSNLARFRVCVLTGKRAHMCSSMTDTTYRQTTICLRGISDRDCTFPPHARVPLHTVMILAALSVSSSSPARIMCCVAGFIMHVMQGPSVMLHTRQVSKREHGTGQERLSDGACLDTA